VTKKDPIIYLSDIHSLDLSHERWKSQGLRGYIAGISGSGKTNLVAVICEELYRIGVPFLIVDPMNDYRSLKELGAGVCVVSARSGDVELSYPKDEWIKATIALRSQGYSVVVDLHSLRASSDKRVAYSALTVALLDHQIEHRRPMFYVIEEAHVFCPQKRQQDVTALELTAEVARQGRRSGLFSILASQRPRDLEADVASQCNLHFCGALEFMLDYEAVRYLLQVPEKGNGRSNGHRPPPRGVGLPVTKTPELYDLMKLAVGEFYVRVGARLNLVQVRKRRTTHIGATPEIVVQGRLWE
jgi:hypothetical protein